MCDSQLRDLARQREPWAQTLLSDRARHSASASRAHRILFAIIAAAAFACGGKSDDAILVGTVERTLIDLVAPVSERITAIGVTRGQRVKAGDVLVNLDPAFALAELASAEAELAGARTGATVAADELQRAVSLHKSNVISQQQLDRARLVRDEAAAHLWAADARVIANRKRVADQTLVAPVDGVIDQLPFDVGERVATGSVLAVILQDGAPWVRVWLPERAYSRIGPGSEARVRVDSVPGELRGHVLDVAREPAFTPHFALTERERVYLVYETRVAIDDAPPALRPGAPARVVLQLPGAVGGVTR